jgi:hypothetical protein
MFWIIGSQQLAGNEKRLNHLDYILLMCIVHTIHSTVFFRKLNMDGFCIM